MWTFVRSSFVLILMSLSLIACLKVSPILLKACASHGTSPTTTSATAADDASSTAVNAAAADDESNTAAAEPLPLAETVQCLLASYKQLLVQLDSAAAAAGAPLPVASDGHQRSLTAGKQLVEVRLTIAMFACLCLGLLIDR